MSEHIVELDAPPEVLRRQMRKAHKILVRGESESPCPGEVTLPPSPGQGTPSRVRTMVIEWQPIDVAYVLGDELMRRLR